MTMWPIKALQRLDCLSSLLHAPPLRQHFSAAEQIRQPRGLPAISRGLRSAATTPPESPQYAPTPEGSQKFWHPLLLSLSDSCVGGYYSMSERSIRSGAVAGIHGQPFGIGICRTRAAAH